MTMTEKRNYPIIVAGAGGGKGGAPRAASEAPNSLRSKQIAHVIDLLGEGEWEGLIDGPAGIYLNDVSLFTPDAPTGDVVTWNETDSKDGVWPVAGKWNFTGVTLEFRNGTQSQSAIKVASSNSSVVSVGTPVTFSTPVTRTITNPNVDTAIVNVQVNALYTQNPETGDIAGHYVDIEIQARHGGGAWTSVKKDRIQGKCMTPYVRAYSVDLIALGAGQPWDIKVVRVSADDPDSSKHSEIVFLGMDIMSRDKFSYPNSVLCSIGIDAKQFNSIPRRAYDVKMARIRVPSNYNPTTRVYTGVWDGSFQIAWSDNPAWCLYDLITNERYGLGEWIDSTLIDKWSLYTIAQYCDELVDDGFGGQEPRFTVNLFLQTAEEAIQVVQNMASIFRGILYYLNESMTAVQDAPSDSVYAFNSTNVVDGQFSYAGASGSTRHTVAMVVWNNPEIDYKQDIEVVEDPVGLARFGYRPVTVQAMGCTSRGQAHRLGRWTLYVEQYESDIVTFSTSLEGTGVQPGNIIDIYDPVRANVRLGGRVTAVDGSLITLDKPLVIAPAGTATFSFIGDDGSLVTREVISDGVTAYPQIILSGTGTMPSPGSVFGIQTTGVYSQQFRIISISESDRHKYEITAVAHNANKYAYVEDGLVLSERPIRWDGGPLAAPTGFEFTETLYLLQDGSVSNRLIVAWAQNPRALKYVLSYQVGSGNWTPEVELETHQFTMTSVKTDWVYSFRVSAIGLNDMRGAQAEVQYTVLGEKFPPPPFDVLSATVMGDGTRRISYGYTVTDKPLDYAGAKIRWGVAADWDTMTPIGEGFFTVSPVETGQIPAGTLYIAAKAVDRSGVESTPKYTNATLGSDPVDVIGGIGAPDLTPPPTPTGFAVAGALTNVIVTTDTATFSQGHGYLKTRLYGKVYTGGALPIFSQAAVIGEFTGTTTHFASDLGVNWRLWVTWVSFDGVESTTPAGGTNGLSAGTGLVGTADLSNQIVTAGKLAAGAVVLSKFDSSITPLEIVSSLPTSGNYEGRLVYLSTDDKLYRHSGSPSGSGGFTKAIDGADLATGTVVAQALAAGSVTAVKLAANAIAVGTAAIENGAIVNAMIGSAAIDTAKIANLAVTNAKISDLDVSKLTAGEILTGNAASKSKISIGNYNAFSSITAAMLATKVATQADHVMIAARNGVDDSVPIWGIIYNGSTTAPNANAVAGTWAAGGSPQLWSMIGTLASSLGEASVWGRSYATTYAGGAFEYSTSSPGEMTSPVISKRIKLATSSYAAHTVSGEGDWYCANNVYGNGVVLTFTGGHLGLLPIGMYQLGDILVDDEIVLRRDVNNALSTVKMSTVASEKGVLGVLSSLRTLTDGETYPDELPYELWWALHETHDLAIVNGVGEGLINVCGENGTIEKGDLIVCSSMPGKGMRQSDDIVRGCTVAKARETVEFYDPSQVKQIACIYLCG